MQEEQEAREHEAVDQIMHEANRDLRRREPDFLPKDEINLDEPSE